VLVVKKIKFFIKKTILHSANGGKQCFPTPLSFICIYIWIEHVSGCRWRWVIGSGSPYIYIYIYIESFWSSMYILRSKIYKYICICSRWNYLCNEVKDDDCHSLSISCLYRTLKHSSLLRSHVWNALRYIYIYIYIIYFLYFN